MFDACEGRGEGRGLAFNSDEHKKQKKKEKKQHNKRSKRKSLKNVLFVSLVSVFICHPNIYIPWNFPETLKMLFVKNNQSFLQEK